MLDYGMLAKQADQWAHDPALGPHARGMANHLAALAGVLADPDYGCPSEHKAAETMYFFLWRTVAAKTARQIEADRGGRGELFS